MTLPIKELRAKAEACRCDSCRELDAVYFELLSASFKHDMHEEFAKWEAETMAKCAELEQLK